MYQKFPLTSSLLGTYEIDLSSIYSEEHHELYQTWLTLTDPTDKRYSLHIYREGVMGYLLVNISLLGPNDQPYVRTLASQRGLHEKNDKIKMPAKINLSGHQI